MVEATGVDGVMIGRAALRDPWIFASAARALRGEPAGAARRPPAERKAVLVEYFEETAARQGERVTVLQMRRFASATYAASRARARSASASRRWRRARTSTPCSTRSSPTVHRHRSCRTTNGSRRAEASSGRFRMRKSRDARRRRSGSRAAGWSRRSLRSPCRAPRRPPARSR